MVERRGLISHILFIEWCINAGFFVRYTERPERPPPHPQIHTPPPPCKLPPLAISPPHPGDRHFHVFLVNMYCAGLCCPSALRMALHCFSHYFKSSTCVCSAIFSLQRRCMGVLCCYFRPKMFTPVDHESAQLSRLEAVAVESPKSPESPDVTPMAPQPQTPAQPTHVPRNSLPFLWILNNICVG